MSCADTDCGAKIYSNNTTGYCKKHAYKSPRYTESRKQAMKRFYAKHPNYYQDSRREKELEKARQFSERLALIKLTYGCADCGYDKYPEALDFDHLPGTVKVAGVSSMSYSAWDRVLEEIDKCEVVCANCHRHRTRIRKEEARGT